MPESSNDKAVTIEALMSEQRTFAPSDAFRAQANLGSESVYAEGDDYIKFWENEAHHIQWRSGWTQALDWSNPPFAKWFVGAKLNVTESCLDRHLADKGDKVAYYFEGEPGDTRTITYRDLYHEVNKLANGLESLGVTKGDRVAIYMGMVPELPISLLAVARLGAVHSVVFGGFSADALRDRINDSEAKVLITCDESWRNGGRVA
ncbi:MAG: AMP-binding protein, partial [Actinomycetota bacterium]|nr:AMP-binding protein [Actinomycetota bacterium]